MPNKHHPKFYHIFLIDYNSQYPWKIIQNLFKFFHVWGFKSTSQCWKMNFLHLIESFEESLMLDWMKLHLKLFWIWFHSYLRACWSFFRTFCKVSFWFEVTDAYSMLSLSTISHASYNPSNDFIRIINYQIFL